MEKIVCSKPTPREVLSLGVYGKIPIDSLCEFYLDTEDGEYIVIYQTKTAKSLGGWIYDGAACLAKYLESQLLPLDTNYSTPLKGKRLIELGAGTGAVGLLAGHYGAEAIVTDLEALVPLLQHNIDMNKHKLTKGKVIAKTLKWGDDCSELLPTPDILILANCIYYVSSFEPLIETMLELCGPETEILACYEVRTKEINKLITSWHSLVEEHFDITYLPDDIICEKYKQDFVKLVKMKRI